MQESRFIFCDPAGGRAPGPRDVPRAVSRANSEMRRPGSVTIFSTRTRNCLAHRSTVAASNNSVLYENGPQSPGRFSHQHRQIEFRRPVVQVQTCGFEARERPAFGEVALQSEHDLEKRMRREAMAGIQRAEDFMKGAC